MRNTNIIIIIIIITINVIFISFILMIIIVLPLIKMIMISKWYDHYDINNFNNDNNNNDNSDDSITVIMIQFQWNHFIYPKGKKGQRIRRKGRGKAYLDACKEWLQYSFRGRPHIFRGSCKHCRHIAWYLLTKNVQE